MSSEPGPFHAGEHAVQARMGVREQIEPWARQVVRDHMPDQHREFYTGLPFLVAAAREREAEHLANVTRCQEALPRLRAHLDRLLDRVRALG